MPRSRFGRRHLASTLGALDARVLCCRAALTRPRARRRATASPLLASMHAVLRSNVGFPLAVDVDLGAPAPATIHARRHRHDPARRREVPPTNPSVAEPVPGTSIARVDVAAVSDVTGWIDTNSREMALQGDVVASLFGSGLENCPIGPATVTLATTNPDGRAFDPDTASATLTTPPDFAFPAIAPAARSDVRGRSPGSTPRSAWASPARRHSRSTSSSRPPARHRHRRRLRRRRVAR